MKKQRKSLGRFILVLIIISLITSSVVTIGFSVINTRTSMEEQLNDNVSAIAKVLSYELDSFEKIEEDYDQLFEKYLMSTAMILDIGENFLDSDLIEIAERTGISEINIVSSEGEIIFSNLTDNIGYKYTKDSDVSKLLLQDGTITVEDIRQSTVDGLYYKYGALGTEWGAIQVGVLATELVEMKRNIDISVVVADLIDEENIIYIASLDKNFNTVFNSLGEDIYLEVLPEAKEIVNEDKIYGEIQRDSYLKKEIFNSLIPRMDSTGNIIGYYSIGTQIESFKIE